MNKIKTTSLTLLLGLFILASCKETTPPEPSAREVQMGLLANMWNVTTGANSVTLDGTDENGNWDGFTVTFNSDGSYATSNASDGRDKVWPSQGTWDFKGDTGADLNTIIRGDGVSIEIGVTETTLQMSFTYDESIHGRLGGVDGAWVFNMSR
jgi:hypothetical protein